MLRVEFKGEVKSEVDMDALNRILPEKVHCLYVGRVEAPVESTFIDCAVNADVFSKSNGNPSLMIKALDEQLKAYLLEEYGIETALISYDIIN